MNPMIPLYAHISTFIHARVERFKDREDRGASLLEYGALIVIVAAIFAAVWKTKIGDTIATNITNKVNEIFNSK